MAENNNPGTDSSAENLELGRQRAKETKDAGFINDQLKERIKLLESTRKKQEEINAQISASVSLARDMKELNSLVYKETTKLELIKKKLSEYNEEEINQVNKIQSRLQKRYEIEKQREQNTKKARKELSEYDVAKERQLLDLTLERLKQQGKSEAEIRQAAQEGIDAIISREAKLKEELETAERKEELSRKATLAEQEAITPRQAALLLLKEAEKEQKKTLGDLDEELKRRKSINERIGIAGHLAKGSHALLEKMGMASFANMEDLTKEMEEAADKGAGKWKIFGLVGSHAIKGIGKALTDPMFILGGMFKLMKGIVESALHYQNHVFDAAKSLGTSLTTAKNLYTNFKGIADSNAKLAMTGHQLLETYTKMNSTLGFMSSTDKEVLTTTAAIQRRLDLSSEDMANIQLYSAQTGKSLKDGYASIVGSAKAQMGKLKFAMSEKQVMEAITKSSATIFMNFKGNAAQMAAAVVKATKFGTTLDEINSAGKSLLDFESSISKEFEAQLLTGKNINLAKAREYALTGQTDKLMDEITKNIGSQEDYMRMNVIQQESLAESMGMSKQQLDEMFKKQQLARELGKTAGQDAATQYNYLKEQGKTHEQIAKIMGQESAQEALKASVQEKAAAAQERLKNAVEKISSALLPIIERVTNWMTGIENLEKKLSRVLTVVKYLGVAYAGIKATQMAFNFLQGKSLTMQLRRLAITMRQQAADAIAFLSSKKNALMGAAEAGAKAAAGSGWAGPGALAIGLAVTGGLLALISSLGGGGGESGGGGGEGMPRIEPMNPATESAKNQPGSKSMSAGANEKPINNYIYVEPVSGRALAKQSSTEAHMDSQKIMLGT